MSKIKHLYLNSLMENTNQLKDKRLNQNLKTCYIAKSKKKNNDSNHILGLLKAINERFNLIGEFSIETSLKCATDQKIKIWKEFNINRVVIKINPDDNFPNLIKLANNINRHNINNICLDIYFDFNILPLKKYVFLIKKIKPQSLYWYSIKEKIAKKQLKNISELMLDFNYKRFELSGYALSEKLQSQHSLAYYSSCDWLAFGKKSYSFINNIYNNEVLEGKDLYFHILIMALKHKDGLNLKNRKHFDTFLFYKKKIEMLIENGDLIKTKNNIFIYDKKWVDMDEILLNIS